MSHSEDSDKHKSSLLDYMAAGQAAGTAARAIKHDVNPGDIHLKALQENLIAQEVVL